jgi:hypothetical protein
MTMKEVAIMNFMNYRKQFAGLTKSTRNPALSTDNRNQNLLNMH